MWKFWNNPINIHCWGGFGSQLYALTLALDLKTRFLNRKIKIYFHTGGVTHRDPEILNLIGDFPYEIINDFGASPTNVSSIGRLRSTSRVVIARFFVMTGLISRGNSDSDFRKIKPWVQTIRGHYSYRSQNITTIGKIFPLTMINTNIDTKFVGIQYRLGDLTLIESKSPIDSNRIALILNQIHDPDLSVKIYSDTPIEAKIRLSQHGIEGITVNKNSYETLIELCQADYFIGTSSKISFWITMLRILVHQKNHTYMPKSNFEQLKLNIGLENSSLIGKY